MTIFSPKFSYEQQQGKSALNYMKKRKLHRSKGTILWHEKANMAYHIIHFTKIGNYQYEKEVNKHISYHLHRLQQAAW